MSIDEKIKYIKRCFAQLFRVSVKLNFSMILKRCFELNNQGLIKLSQCFRYFKSAEDFSLRFLKLVNLLEFSSKTKDVKKLQTKAL